MKIKKHFSFTDKNQIWRLLINNNNKIVIETRDTVNKLVYFNCFDLKIGKPIFSNLQFEEKFWIGIEKVENDIIYFHHFARPNMPEHKRIIAYSISRDKIIWQNDDLAFLTLMENKLYAFRKNFEGQDIFVIDPSTGKIIEELGNSRDTLTAIMNVANNIEDYSNYTYPEKQIPQTEIVKSLIEKETKGKVNVENIESMQFGNYLCFNYYLRKQSNFLDNVFVVYDIEKKKKVISEVINRELNSLSPDSFFAYDKTLFVLKNKIELLAYKLK